MIKKNSSVNVAFSFFFLFLSLTLVGTLSAQTSPDMWIYQEKALSSPWINACWSCSTNIKSSDRAFQGATSIKETLGPWGAFRAMNGDWGATAALNPSKYSGVSFAIWPSSPNVTIAVMLGNEQTAAFNTHVYGQLAPNKWTAVFVPISDLDPNNIAFSSVMVEQFSNGNATYYLDNLRLVGLADTVAPSVSITSPTAGSTVSGSLSVTASATDNVGVASVQFQLDGANAGSLETSTPYSYALDTKTLANGAHTIGVVATDAAGNAGSSTVSVNVNNVVANPYYLEYSLSPDRSSPLPLSGASLPANTDAYIFMLPTAGPSQVVFSLDGGSYTHTELTAPWDFHDGTASGAFPWGTGAAASHTITAAITTSSGPLNLSTSFSVAAPAQFCSPGSLKANTTCLVCNAAGTTFAADGSKCATGFTCSANGSCTSTIVPDTTAPAVLATISPTAPTSSQQVAYTAVASDASGIKQIQIYVDGVAVQNCPGVTTCSFTGGAYVAGSSHAYYASATDNSANANVGTSAKGSFTVSSPAIVLPSVAIVSPSGGSTVSGTVAIMANASSKNGALGSGNSTSNNIQSVQFYLDGTALGQPDTSTPYSVSWDTTFAANGPHTITAVGIDSLFYSNNTSEIIYVNNIAPNMSNNTTVDTTPPVVLVSISPTSPTSAQQVAFTATASDASGIKQIQIFVDGSAVQTCNAVTTCAYTSSAFSGGSSHAYYATAQDNAAVPNTGSSATGSFTVQTAPPVNTSGKFKVMALGDSITDTTCYPPFVLVDLNTSGYVYNKNWVYIGSHITNTGQGITCNNVPYYLPSEGHRFYHIAEVARDLPGWLANNSQAGNVPDLVFIHIGTNDVGGTITASTVASMLSSYTTIVNELRASNPKVKILAEQIIPRTDSAAATASTNLFDDAMPAWVATVNTAQSPVTTVDLRPGFLSSWTFDGLHPNPTGSQYMADKVAPMLAQFMGGTPPANVCSAGQCNGTSYYCNGGQWAACTSGTTCSSGTCAAPQICTPGAQNGTTCLVCNGAGSGFAPSNSLCPSGICNANGTCAPVSPPATSSNLALNKPVFVSSIETSSFVSPYAVDGNNSTRWSSLYSDPQWIYVDLGSTYSVNKVVLNWEVAYASAYQVQVSNDATNWATVFSKASGTGGVESDSFPAANGRYVRVYGTARGTKWGYSLWEFEVYGSNATAMACTPGSVKANTACLVCNSAGSDYTVADGTKCANGQSCNASGQCVNNAGLCTPGSVQNGTTCNTCNAQGTAYVSNSSLCSNGFACNSAGACVNSSGKWVVAYYAGWMQSTLPASAIDYSAVSQINYFAAIPNSNGTLDLNGNSVSNNANQATLISMAHAKGVKVILTVGGWSTESAFMSATSAGTRTAFVNNLVAAMVNGNYDGLDIDWEPLSSGDQANYVAFSQQLRSAMTAAKPGSTLAMATQWSAPVAAAAASSYDQVNLMTYDLSGLWTGWVTWFNSPVYDNNEVPGQDISANAMVNKWNAAGVPLSKLGIGIDWYGYKYAGVTGPRQSISGGSLVQGNRPYSTIMGSDYPTMTRVWDSKANATYLTSSTGWVTYDDEQSIQAKADYVRSKGIGGAIIWELGGGYRASMPAGQKDQLLQAVKSSFGSTGSGSGGSSGNNTSSTDKTAPVVTASASPTSPTSTQQVAFSATASDASGVKQIQIFIDGSAVQTCNAATTCAYTGGAYAAGSSHAYYATAQDNAPTPNTGASASGSFAVQAALPPANTTGFVTVQNATFYLGGKPLYFAGTNAYYLQTYEKLNPSYINTTLDTFVANNISVVRTWGSHDGSFTGCGYPPGDPVIQTSPGVFDEQGARYLDEVVYKAKQRNIKLLISFGNYWGSLGGICTYDMWAGLSPTQSYSPSYADVLAFHNNSNIKQMYKNWISYLLNRVNYKTGVAYKDEPAIFGWELINEDKLYGDADGKGTTDPTLLNSWYKEMAAYVKSIDSKHVLGSGDEGFDVNGGKYGYTASPYTNQVYQVTGSLGTSFALNSQIPQFDYMQIHLYPNEWGWGSANFASYGSSWILDHNKIAKDHGKPLIVGEYGTQTNALSTNQNAFGAWWNTIYSNNVSGSMLWEFDTGTKCHEYPSDICTPGDTTLISLFDQHGAKMNAKSN